MAFREEVIGPHRLILGDCREIAPSLEYDSVCGDPPYGIGYSPGGGGGGIKRKDGSRYAKTFSGDNLVIGDNEPFDPSPWIDRPCILWGGNHFASRLPDSASWLIWDKRRGTSTNDFADCEMAWTNLGGVARVLPHMWNGMLKDSERGVQRFHPTQKAIAVMEWAIGFLPPGVILEPWLGSGTTIVACERMGRKGIGIELDPGYFDIACRRVEEAVRQPRLNLEPAPKMVQTGMDL